MKNKKTIFKVSIATFCAGVLISFVLSPALATPSDGIGPNALQPAWPTIFKNMLSDWNDANSTAVNLNTSLGYVKGSRSLVGTNHGIAVTVGTATNENYVGIGTANPAHPLDVTGTVRATRFIGNMEIPTGGSLAFNSGTLTLPNSSIVTNFINNNAVTTDKINNNAITTAKIINNAVTNDKIDSVDWSKVTNKPFGTNISNYITKWNGSQIIKTVGIYENESGNVGIGNTIPGTHKLNVSGSIYSNNSITAVDNIGASTVTASTSMTAPRFIDSNDNAFYVDPASISILNTAETNIIKTSQIQNIAGSSFFGSCATGAITGINALGVPTCAEFGTNLAQGIRTATEVPITSSTGTNATLQEATTTLAGVMTASDKAKLDNIEAGAEANDPTNLGYTTAVDSGTVTSSTGDDATIPAATTTLAGLLTASDKAKLDNIEAGAEANDPTNLGYTTAVDSGTVTSSTGDDATIPAATTTIAGLVTTGAQTFGGTKTFSTIYSSSYLYTSDKRFKENIQPLSSSLDKVKKLQGVSFNWKENNKKSIGLIAQDVEKVFPDLVKTNEETGAKAVEYGNLVAPLIEAIKEQQKQIETLEKRIAELENK